jgi:hypothetical protein
MYCTDAVEGWDERISTVSGREDAMGGLWRGGPADRLSCATVSFFDHPVSLFAAWHGPSQTTAFPLSYIPSIIDYELTISKLAPETLSLQLNAMLHGWPRQTQHTAWQSWPYRHQEQS